MCVIMCRDCQYVPSSLWCAPAVSEANIRLTQRRVQARWTALYSEACSPLWHPACTHTQSQKSLKWLMFNFPILALSKWRGEDLCVCVELWMLTSELAYTLSTHSLGARISGSQLTTTPIKLPFLSITTSPTRRNTYGGRGLRAVFEAAGRKKRERILCAGFR